MVSDKERARFRMDEGWHGVSGWPASLDQVAVASYRRDARPRARSALGQLPSAVVAMHAGTRRSVDGRRVARYGAGLDAADIASTSRPCRGEQQPQLARRVARRSTGRPRSRSPASSRTSVRSWCDAGGGVEASALVEVAHREVGVEGASAPGCPPGRSARAIPASTRRRRRRRPSAGRTRPGRGRSTASNSASNGERPGVERARTSRRRARSRRAELDEPLARCRCRATTMPRAGQRVRVAARAAPDVEHPHARLEPERVDEEVDLLRGALGERVAEVRRAEVVGDRLEPVVRRVSRSRPWRVVT